MDFEANIIDEDNRVGDPEMLDEDDCHGNDGVVKAEVEAKGEGGGEAEVVVGSEGEGKGEFEVESCVEYEGDGVSVSNEGVHNLEGLVDVSVDCDLDYVVNHNLWEGSVEVHIDEDVSEPSGNYSQKRKKKGIWRDDDDAWLFNEDVKLNIHERGLSDCKWELEELDSDEESDTMVDDWRSYG